MMALPSVAQNELSSLGILAIAKMAGACGILDSMIQMQKTTKMPGGDEFVTRCNVSIGAYNKLWNAVEE